MTEAKSIAYDNVTKLSCVFIYMLCGTLFYKTPRL